MTEDQFPVQSIEELNKELKSFLEPDHNLKMPSNATCYTIIGNTSGSREQLLINEIINKIPPFMKVFIVFENSFHACSEFVRNNFSHPVEKVISLDEIGGVKGGIINLDWTIPSRLKTLLMLIEQMGDDCVICLATGSNADGQVKERLNMVAHISNKIVISVNKQDDWSLCPAFHLAHVEGMQRANFALWEKINLDEGYQYNLTVLSCEEMKQLDIS